MSSLSLYRPLSKPTLRVVEPPAMLSPTPGIDPWALVIGRPELSTDQVAFDYGWACGLDVLQPAIPDATPAHLVDRVWEGWELGRAEYKRRLEEEAAAAIEAASPTDAEVAEALLAPPTPEDVAAGLRALLAKIDSEDASAELARIVLEDAALDFLAYRAVTWQEVRDREYEMAAATLDRGPCPACSREAL